MKTLLAGLVVALTGCASAPPPPNTVRVGPPAPLLADCPTPELQLDTNGALAAGILTLRRALDDCNADKSALREWAKGL